MLVADYTGLLIAAFVAIFLAQTLRVPLALLERYAVHIVTLCSVLPLLYLLLDLYPGVGLNPIVELRNITLGTTSVFAILLVVNAAFGEFTPDEMFLIPATAALALVLIPICRSLTRAALGGANWWSQPAIIVGTGASARALYVSLCRFPGSGLRPIGFVDDMPVDEAEIEPELHLGPISRVEQIANEGGARWALIALSDLPPERLSSALDQCAEMPHRVLVPGLAELPSLWNRTHDCGGMMGIHMRERLLCPSSQFFKRLIDLFVVTIGGLCLLPFFAVTCALIKLISPGSAFYGHERIGRDGRRFNAWKFRTMVVDADKKLARYLAKDAALREEWELTQKLKNDPRIIRGIGHFLRKTSLDELPQLWNVFLGEMSLVGPRPIVTEEIARYGGVFPLYLKVRPGITGLWQISGRNLTTYEERVNLDAYYIRNWSVWFDVFILGRTVKTVAMREGAY